MITKANLFKDKSKKRLKNPKRKGNSFENKVAKDLSLWVTNGEKKDVLMRAPTSGARSTILAKYNEIFANQAGDIVAVSEEGTYLTKHFLIECKHRNDLALLPLILGRNNVEGILKFWLKLQQECATYSKLPLLIARQNNNPVLLGICNKGLNFFDLKHSIIPARFNQHDLNIMLYEEFLEIAVPELLRIK